MGDVGDYWNEVREERNFHKHHGRYPNQLFCTRCGSAFRPRSKRHSRCQHCSQAWAAGYELLPRRKGAQS